MKKQHLLYGIRNNKLVHISEVEKGIKCDCTCPACKGRLIAKKGIKLYIILHIIMLMSVSMDIKHLCT